MISPRRHAFSVPARLDQLAAIAEMLRRFMSEDKSLADNAAFQYDVELAVNEVVVNIITHAYAGSDGVIDVRLEQRPTGLLVETADRGRAFDPAAVPTPDLDNPQEHGYGLLIVHRLMDGVQYRHHRGRNFWQLFKRTA